MLLLFDWPYMENGTWFPQNALYRSSLIHTQCLYHIFKKWCCSSSSEKRKISNSPNLGIHLWQFYDFNHKNHLNRCWNRNNHEKLHISMYIRHINHISGGPWGSRPTERPTDRPTERPNERPTCQLTDRPVDRLTNLLTDRPVDQPADLTTNRTTGCPTNRPINWLTCRHVNQSTDRPADYWSVNRLTEWPHHSSLSSDEVFPMFLGIEVF
mgnify:CR=1 FL=1